MGLSQSAVFAVLGVCFLIIIELFSGVLFSAVYTLNSSGNKTWDRDIDEIHSKINITDVIDPMTATTWWNASFPFRKQITINPALYAGKNYQVNFSIGCSYGGDFDLDGNSYNFPHDLRFIDDNQITQLSYWIKNTSVDPITVWVKIVDDLNITARTIYVYYGNPDVSTTSNGTNTFIFFDDFETSLTKWETHTQCGDAHVERNNTRATGGEWSAYVYTTEAAGCRALLNGTLPTKQRDVAVEFDWAPKAGISEAQTFATYTTKGGNYLGNLYAVEDSSPFNFQYFNGAVLFPLAAEYTEDMEWHNIQQFYDFSDGNYDIYIDDTLQQNDAMFVSPGLSIGFITFQSGAGGDMGHQFIDSFRIRNWTSNAEPSFHDAKAQETNLLTIALENTGNINLRTTDFLVLVNGTLYYTYHNYSLNRCSCNNPYLFPLNEITIYTTTPAAAGYNRVKVIADTGAEDYYQKEV